MYYYVKDCNNFYNYGDIESHICAHCYEYDYEQLETFNCIENIKQMYPNCRVFLYLIKTIYYPMSFIDKKFGLWENLKREKSINFINSSESVQKHKNHISLCGLAEIPFIQVERAVNILCNYTNNSFIILSNCNLFNEIKIHDFLKITNTGIIISFSDLINHQTYSNIVMTAIKGNNGISLNLFQKQSDG